MKYKLSKNKSRRNKSRRNKKQKSKRNTIKKRHSSRKRGGSRSYNMDTGEYLAVEDGKDVFRKILSQKENNEYDIVNFLMNFPEYKEHNIVTIYELTPEYIDMEDLATYFTKSDIDKYIEAMRKAKDYLQSLGIMYLDWKEDNIGKSQDGNYKLFDFDAAGIANLETNKWIIEPIYLNSYGRKKNLPPKALDDFLFEKNMVERQMISYGYY
jgi:serine/threonine protein kinase